VDEAPHMLYKFEQECHGTPMGSTVRSDAAAPARESRSPESELMDFSRVELSDEYPFRLAAPMGIHGGTLEVFRNMIAQHALGLGRPNHSPARVP
jgi:hypothetical protein